MSDQFDPKNWYWFVGGDQTRAFSSASGGFVPATDPTFTAWLAAGNVPTNVMNAADLGQALANIGVRPTDATVLAGFQIAKASALDEVILRVLFNHENRIRTLAGQAQVTRAQFLNALAALL